MIEIITGNLLDSNDKYICHQTNCVSVDGVAGIAKAIFEKYVYADCYSTRIEPSVPGTIDIRGNGINQRFIVNIHSQYYPGRSKYQESNLDGVIAREKYFHKGLLNLAKISNLESVAFPWRIGCSIAGGNWQHYLGTITNFANYIEKTQGAKVIIYRREEDII